MLIVSHVTKCYGKTVANRDINLSIADGEICILLGPNGAGKSTLIKNIIGFHKYDGNIMVNGHVNKTLEAKRLMGYVPEIPSLYPTLTVEEHLEFIARVYRLTDYKEYKEELLERFELADKRSKFGDELSKGMQQKLSVCCGLLPRPQMMLFDEPMIGLDPHAIKEMKKLFVELRATGCSLLVSTHMIDSIEELWDTTYIMKEGRIEAVVRKSDVEDGGKSLEDIFFEITEGRAETDGESAQTDSDFVQADSGLAGTDNETAQTDGESAQMDNETAHADDEVMKSRTANRNMTEGGAGS